MAASLDDDERRQVLGEVLADELKAIHEYVQDIPRIKTNIEALRVEVDELRSDMKVVKVASRENGHDLSSFDVRIAKLEAAQA